MVSLPESTYPPRIPLVRICLVRLEELATCGRKMDDSALVVLRPADPVPPQSSHPSTPAAARTSTARTPATRCIVTPVTSRTARRW